LVIAVAAGKGGTGKTLVAVNLALALHREGVKTLLLDADVEEPNAHLFLKPEWYRHEPVMIPMPEIDPDLCDLCGDCARACAYGALAVTREKVLLFEELCHGCGACGLVCSPKAVNDKGRGIGVLEFGRTGESLEMVRGLLDIGEPKASPVISRLKEYLDPEAVNIVDCGPGTGCAAMTTVRGADLCLMVTEPTPFGLHDMGMAVEMAGALGVRSVVVVNKDFQGEAMVREFCAEKDLEIVLSIPFSEEIARSYSRGANLVDEGPAWQGVFMGLYRRLQEAVQGMVV
jgi:MinD superfamily P-loop ATPase